MNKAIKNDPLYQAYLLAGYKGWNSPSLEKLKGTPYFIQKRIVKGKHTLFFINVYVYDNIKDDNRVGYQPEVYFNTDGKPMFHVVYNERHSPRVVERFFRKMYRVMGCVPYE